MCKKQTAALDASSLTSGIKATRSKQPDVSMSPFAHNALTADSLAITSASTTTHALVKGG